MNQSLDHDFDERLLEGYHGAEAPDVISGSGFGAIVAVRPTAWQIFAALYFQSLFKVLRYCHKFRLATFHSMFCLFINPLISGDNLFTGWAVRAGLFIVWNPGCLRKRTSRQVLKSGTVSYRFIFLLFVCLTNHCGQGKL